MVPTKMPRQKEEKLANKNTLGVISMIPSGTGLSPMAILSDIRKIQLVTTQINPKGSILEIFHLVLGFSFFNI